MYTKDRPLIPRLHRCHWCGRRLSAEMSIVALPQYYDDMGGIDYYCSEKCAKEEYWHDKNEEDGVRELNKRIKEDND